VGLLAWLPAGPAVAAVSGSGRRECAGDAAEAAEAAGEAAAEPAALDAAAEPRAGEDAAEAAAAGECRASASSAVGEAPLLLPRPLETAGEGKGDPTFKPDLRGDGDCECAAGLCGDL